MFSGPSLHPHVNLVSSDKHFARQAPQNASTCPLAGLAYVRKPWGRKLQTKAVAATTTSKLSGPPPAVFHRPIDARILPASRTIRTTATMSLPSGIPEMYRYYYSEDPVLAPPYAPFIGMVRRSRSPS